MSSDIPHRTEAEEFVVEIDGIVAGIAVRRWSGFRFSVVDSRFRMLDGCWFHSLELMERTARRSLEPFPIE